MRMYQHHRYGRDRVLQVTALTPTIASTFELKELRWYLREHHDEMAEVVADICAHLAEAEDRIADMAREGAARRLARLLCKISAFPGVGSEISLGLSHSDFASLRVVTGGMPRWALPPV
jgi:CRP-like cAMP-binding protein